MNPAFWSSKRVFVTGHTGFKGGWLCLWLESLGAKVSGYSLPASTKPSLFELARVASGLDSALADIRDLPRFTKSIVAANPEIVFHLAAQPLVRASYAAPVETFATNVMGTVHVLESVRRCPSARAVVVVTSDKCYENREWVWAYREGEAMGGHDPYSASKGCAELVTAAYRRSFFGTESGSRCAAVASARAGNVIGGGDWADDRLVPDIVRSIGRGEPARIRNLGAVRPWQHVLEPLHGYLALAERLHESREGFASGWNFGPWESDTRSVEWLTRKFMERWGEGAGWEREGSAQPHEANVLKLDSAKAHELLGWRPRLDLESALDWTVSWYKAQSNSADMRAVTLEQIKRFQELI